MAGQQHSKMFTLHCLAFPSEHIVQYRMGGGNEQIMNKPVCMKKQKHDVQLIWAFLRKKKSFKDSLQNNQLPPPCACNYSLGLLSDQQQHWYSWSDSQENTIAYFSEVTIWDSMKFQVYFSSWSHTLWGFINLAVLQEVITIMSNVTFSYQNLPSLLLIPNISPCFRGIVFIFRGTEWSPLGFSACCWVSASPKSPWCCPLTLVRWQRTVCTLWSRPRG